MHPLSPTQLGNEKSLDLTLRPKTWDKFIGQEKIKKNLNIFIEAARKRAEPIEHVLLYGPPGIGKTSLAYVIGKEMRVGIKTTSGPAIERPGDLASILTNLQDQDILFIDEIHRLNRIIEESLYPAMEEYRFDIIIGKGPGARIMKLDLPKFTLIGATTKIGQISSPLRDRFGITHRLNFYKTRELETIIKNSAKFLQIKIDDEAAEIIAERSRKTPRIANRLLKRARDLAQVKGNGEINSKIAKDTLRMLEIDELGLDDTDRRILKYIIEKFDGGPVGLGTLAQASSEEEETIEEVYEPFLMQIGFLARTPRGRIATKLAYEHLGIKYSKENQNKLI